jgi:hypothetical protein
MFRRNIELTFPNRSIMVSFIILLSLVSVACGELKINVFTGDTSGSSGYTESLGAKINDQIHESTTLTGSSLSQSFKSNGDKTETFSVTNSAGDHAEVGFDIKNSKSYSGSYTLSPETASYALATEKLDVNTADSIHAFANANSRDGYTAGSGVDVTKGSLIRYTNSAYATLGEATTKQSWSVAYGDVNCMVEAINKDGLKASVAAGMGIGSIDILQSGTASKKDVYAWQEIDSASGDTIELSAATSDKSGNMADSSLTVDGNGFLKDYRSAAEATLLKHGVIDLYAIHGPFNLEDKEKNPIGKISGDLIHSEGSASNTAMGLEALYDVTIKCGSIEGRFDWGTETKSDGWVIAVPLESPAAWDGYQGKIKISASEVWSNSEALLDGTKVVSNSAYAQGVRVRDWKQGYGFAAPSEAKKK